METREPRMPFSIQNREPSPSIVRLIGYMRHSAVSARAGFPRCPPIVWRPASSALLALVVLAACGSTAGSGGSGSGGATGGSAGAGGNVTRDVPFAEVTSVAYGRHDTGPAIVVAL